MLDTLLARVQEAKGAAVKRPPLLVKLSPDIANADLPEIVRVIRAHGVDGIVVSNTTLSRQGLKDASSPRKLEDSRGARFRPCHPHARPSLQARGRKLPLIGVGGIDSGAAAVAKIEAGARCSSSTPASCSKARS